MQHRPLGPHSVAALGFGAMSLGGAFGRTTEEESFRCLDAAWEAGLTHIDTANIYGPHTSEITIGRWLASRKHRPILATKAAIIPGPPRQFDNSESYLRQELEASLKRLGRDHVELFYIHRRDIRIPIEDLAGTLSRLIEEGKIGGYGLSEIAPSTLRAAHAVHPVMAVQNEYSLWSRQPELGLIQASAELGITFVAFSPLARGMFADMPLPLPADGFRRSNPRFTEPNFSANQALIAPFRAFAQSRGWTTPATALAWLLAQAPHILPIPATRYAAHLQDWLALPALTAADLAEINRLLPPGFAHGDRYSQSQTQGVETYC